MMPAASLQRGMTKLVANFHYMQYNPCAGEESGTFGTMAKPAFTPILLEMHGVAPPLARTACAQPLAVRGSPAAENEIRAAMILFYAARNSEFHGDLNPLIAVWSHPLPKSQTRTGRATWHWDGPRFAPTFEIWRGFIPPAKSLAPQNFVGDVVVGEIGYSFCNETGELRSSDGPMDRVDRRAQHLPARRRQIGK